MQQAAIAVRAALAVDEQSPEAHNALGYVLAMQGEADEALQSYRRAMDLDEWYLEPLLNAIELLVQPDGDAQEGLRLCAEARELVLDEVELAEVVLLEADALLLLERFDEARARAREIEDPAALPPWLCLALGRLHFDLQDTGAAKAHVDRAIELGPENGDAWYYRGLIAREEGRRVDAVIAFHETRERDAAQTVPEWYGDPAEIASLARRAIGRAGDQVARLFHECEIRVEKVPTAKHIREEVDPRLLVFAEGIDPVRGAFERLWVFFANMIRAGIGPSEAEEELVEIIRREAMPGGDRDGDV